MKKHLFIIFMMVTLLGVGVGCKKDVYVGGHTRISSYIAVPGYWKNGGWQILPRLYLDGNAFVTSLPYLKAMCMPGGIAETVWGSMSPAIGKTDLGRPASYRYGEKRYCL